MRAIVSAIVDQQGLVSQFYWPRDLLKAEMATAEAIGVFEADCLAGFILYRELPGAQEISLVATHPQYRRKGLMAELLKYMIQVKPQDKEIWLEVHHENYQAQQLYEKMGFIMSGRRPGYYKDGAAALLYSHP
jgi:ribosomal-protein-alanine N-acetyltransferase